jgi:hypothetical protein
MIRLVGEMGVPATFSASIDDYQNNSFDELGDRGYARARVIAESVTL